MENILIKTQEDKPFIPSVSFDASTGVCTIEGESYLEDSMAFYNKLAAWVKEYHEQGGESIVLSVKLKYFNTSSSRSLLDFFKAVKSVKDNGLEVDVTWYYPDIDPDILMDGEDFMDEAELDMEFEEYNIVSIS